MRNSRKEKYVQENQQNKISFKQIIDTFSFNERLLKKFTFSF